MKEFSNRVVYLITKKIIIRYHKVKDHTTIGGVWRAGMCKEPWRMALGDKYTGIKGTKAIFAMTHNEIDCITEDIVVTYAHIIIDCRPQKEDPNVFFTTAYRPDHIQDTMEHHPQHRRNIFHRLCYLNFVLPWHQHWEVHIHEHYLSCSSHDKHEMNKNTQNGHMYLEIFKAIYELPAAGALTNAQLQTRWASRQYYTCIYTPGF